MKFEEKHRQTTQLTEKTELSKIVKLDFGKNLRILREAEKLKQNEFAEKIGVTQRKVSYWETEKVEPSLADLWKIADFFGISVDELIGRNVF